MGLREETLAEIERLQARLAIINRVPEDTFNIGTLVVFAKGDLKWYYEKVAEETWKNKNNKQKSLLEWIVEAEESSVGYFEVYILLVQETPIFASTDPT